MQQTYKLLRLPKVKPEGQSFEKVYVVANQLRIVKQAHRTIVNLIKLGRLTEAENASQRFTGILRAWAVDDSRERDAAMKKSNPISPAFPSKELRGAGASAR